MCKITTQFIETIFSVSYRDKNVEILKNPSRINNTESTTMQLICLEITKFRCKFEKDAEKRKLCNMHITGNPFM